MKILFKSIPIHNISFSHANGPGKRLVIWTQGCSLNCKGCFNSETHHFDKSLLRSPDSLASQINNQKNIEGITISGGEPLEYPVAIYDFLYRLNSDLTVILYSGFTIKEILKDPHKSRILKVVDLAIVGRYQKKLNHPYMGKKFLNVTGRIDLQYYNTSKFVEYNINGEKITKTGIY